MALKSTGNHQHGCVVVKGGAVIARGWNAYRNDRYRDGLSSRHAECHALSQNWLSEFKGATMYIVRLRKDQPFGMSKPCAACEEAICKAGIAKVVYTSNDVLNPVVLEKPSMVREAP